MIYDLGVDFKNERRKTQRLHLPFKVKFKPKGKKCPWQKADPKNISGGGIGVFMNKPFRPNDKVEMLLYMKGYPRPISAICKVDWYRQVEEDKFRVGLKFIEIKDHPEFMIFLCEKMVDLSLNQQGRRSKKKRRRHGKT